MPIASNWKNAVAALGVFAAAAGLTTADAMAQTFNRAESMLHVERTPLPQWVRFVGARTDEGEPSHRAIEPVDAGGCVRTCGPYGHVHAAAWNTELPVSDTSSFWGALGCSCWNF